jgi:hypothetical protein
LLDSSKETDTYDSRNTTLVNCLQKIGMDIINA